MRHILVGFLSLFASLPAFASPGQWIELGYQNIWLGGPATADDVQHALTNDLTNTMKKFYPNGKNISHYSATGNGTWTRISFKATKDIGPFTKTATIVASANSPGRSSWCEGNNVGSYYLEFDLGGSSSIITDNAQAYGLDICVYSNGDNSFTLKSKVWMKEGGDFGGPSGKSTKDTLRAQAYPMLLAISKKATEFAQQR